MARAPYSFRPFIKMNIQYTQRYTKPDESIQIWQNNTKRTCYTAATMSLPYCFVIFYCNRNSIQALAGFKRGHIYIHRRAYKRFVWLLSVTVELVDGWASAIMHVGFLVVNVLGMFYYLYTFDRLDLKKLFKMLCSDHCRYDQ